MVPKFANLFPSSEQSEWRSGLAKQQDLSNAFVVGFDLEQSTDGFLRLQRCQLGFYCLVCIIIWVVGSCVLACVLERFVLIILDSIRILIS